MAPPCLRPHAEKTGAALPGREYVDEICATDPWSSMTLRFQCSPPGSSFVNLPLSVVAQLCSRVFVAPERST